MRAFHNDEKIKQKYIERIKAHAIADEIIKGVYWENGKGCAVGCTLHSENHSKYETELGIPKILAYLEDRIFENLPNELSKTWPLRFLESINVGSDLSKVWPKFAIFLLTDPTQCNSRHPQCSIVAKNFQKELDGKKINWLTVRKYSHAAYADADAAAAAYAAADAYAAAYAAYAAYAAAAAAAAADAAAAAYAAAAADAAAYAAYAAAYADAAAYAAAKQRAYINQSEKLLELLHECN